jgi:hypothetical protein
VHRGGNSPGERVPARKVQVLRIVEVDVPEIQRGVNPLDPEADIGIEILLPFRLPVKKRFKSGFFPLFFDRLDLFQFHFIAHMYLQKKRGYWKIGIMEN